MRAKTLILAVFFLFILIFVTSYYDQAQSGLTIPDNINPKLKIEIEKLFSNKPLIRSEGAMKISEFANEGADAIPFLISALKDDMALEWLIDNDTDNDSDKGNKISRNLQSPGEESAKALVKIGAKSVEPLLEILNTPNPIARKNAAWALGELRNPKALPPLILCLKDNDTNLRWYTAAALGKFNDPNMAKYLIESLEDTNSTVRGAAIKSLSSLKYPEVIELLLNSLKETDKKQRNRYIVKCLKNIAGKDIGNTYKLWNKWWIENKKKYIGGTHEES